MARFLVSGRLLPLFAAALSLPRPGESSGWPPAAATLNTDTPKDIFGEIGGKITLYCNVSSPGKQNFLYWQKMQGDETTFINGYYENKDVEPHVPVKYKNHFRFNRPLGTLEILHLSLKDRGIYTCVTANQKSFSFNLILPDSVNYSRPEILLGRRNGEVVVNCSSSAGHPFRVPEWRLLPENSHTQWDVVDNGGWLDNVTDLWSVFSTVTLNCSRPLNISCSVGGAISKELSICHEHQDIMLIVAGTVMASMIFVALVVAVVKMRRVSYNRASNGPAAFPLRSTSPPLSGHGTGEEENSKLTQSC